MANELDHYEETMLAEISPLEARSRQLLADAGAVQITDDLALKDANSLKKDINSHVKSVKDLRLELTRPIDGLKNSLLEKEKEILAPAEQAKKLLGDNILAYEEEQERIRREEADRIEKIARDILGHYQPGMTKSQVEQAKLRGKRYVTELPTEDAAQPSIRSALLTLSNRLTERMQDIELDEQRAKKQKLDRKQEEIDAQRQANADREAAIVEEQRIADEAAARAEKARPKSNIVEVTEFEIVNEFQVPREYCSPDASKIRAAVKAGLTEISGIRVFKTKKVR